jgi:uncharacterized protein
LTETDAIEDEPDLTDPDPVQRAHSPMRTCIVTRVEKSPDDMIRFVVGPDGSIVPDLARRLPGRGVWVTLARANVDAAIKTKAFPRSLKRQVQVPADLGDLVGRLLRKRTIESLSLANKAGQVLTGFAKVDAELGRGDIPLALVHASDCADDGRGKLDRKWAAINESFNRPALILTPLTIDELSLAIGRENVVHASLRTGGAATRFVEAATRSLRFHAAIDGPPA